MRTFLSLHPAQRDIYTDQLIHADSPKYNIGGYIKIKGRLNIDKFRAAVNSAPEVFDVFKMRFVADPDQPLCFLEENYTRLSLEELDFTDRNDPATEARKWMQTRFNIPFIINEENLLCEYQLLKIAGDEHWLFGRCHHLITDGYGFIVFVQYVGKKYTSLVTGNSIQFSYPLYHSELQKESGYFSSAVYQSDAAYWKQKISEKPSKILSKKYRLQKGSDKTTATYTCDITEEQRKMLDQLQLTVGMGLQQLTIAALLIYFGKISGETEFIFGIPLHKRVSRQLRNIVGMFSGILPFKGKYQKEQSLIELLHEINQIQRTDYRHQMYPLGELSRQLKIASSDGYLHEISVNYELLNFELDFGNEIVAGITRLTNEHELNPLQLCWRDYGKQHPLQLCINFGTEYFSDAEIELLGGRIFFVFEQFQSFLHMPVGNIEVLPAPEKELLLTAFGTSSVDLPIDENIVSLFEKQVIKTPTAVALAFENNIATYKELNEKVNKLAHYLISQGITSQMLVPVYLERSFEMILGILGILKAGAAYVPIDPGYPEERIKFMLQDTAATLLLTGKKEMSRFELPGVEVILLDEHWPLIDVLSSENPHTAIGATNLAYVIYTSGSTGKPKGVMIEHAALTDHCFGVIKTAALHKCASFALFSPLAFDAGHSMIHSSFLLGAALHVLSDSILEDGKKLHDYINDHSIDCIKIVPSLWLTYSDSDQTILAKKVMIFGGEGFSMSIPEQLIKAGYSGDVYNHYGPTEATIGKCIHKVDLEKEYNSVPIGKPFSNTQLYILDDKEQLVPVGVAAQLHIAGNGLARGYLNLPGLTAAKFVADPFSNKPGARMYKTGDLTRWLSSGEIDYLGRIDEQVKVRGYRIELGEIENVLNEFETVKQGVVAAKEDKDGRNRLVGFVVPIGSFDRNEVQNYLRKRLPAYMVPSLWVVLENIPLTSNGKVNRKALPDPGVNETVSEKYIAPATPMEIQLAALWKDLLKLERVGVNDNFFEAGGHSLNAIQLTSRLHKLMNIKTDIQTIFSNPTIRQLSQALGEKKPDQFVEINCLPAQDHYPLSHTQKRFWVLSHFKDGSEAYNVSKAFTIEGNLNINAFKKAFDTVIGRHEILRSVFAEIDGEPRQKILSLHASKFVMDEIDVRGKKDTQILVKDLLEKYSRHPFDLETGPLLCATLFRETDERFILVINIHHIISDGWSKAILIKEILHSYKAYSTGIADQLPSLPLQYKDYAAWHNASYEAQYPYWAAQYGNGVPVLNFPVDFKRPKLLSFFGAMCHVPISTSLTEQLRRKAVDYRMSLNNLLFALYGLLVARYSGQQEVVIGSLTSGRSHVDLENLVGVFINFLPIKLLPKKELALAAYLTDSNQSLLLAYNNQDYPFDLMVDKFIQQRDISRNPFFDTMVNFHLENGLQGNVDFGKEELAGTGISMKPYHPVQQDLFQSLLDFKIDIEISASNLDFYLSYNSKLFLKETMSSFLDEFVKLLGMVVDEPAKNLQDYGEWIAEKAVAAGNENMQAAKQPALLPVHICASFVLEPVQEYVEYWSNELDLNIELSFAPYNQVFQQLLNPQSALHRNKGINVLCIRVDDWLRDQADLSVTQQIIFLDQTYSAFIDAIENINKVSFVPFFTGIVPLYNIESFDAQLAGHIQKINSRLEDFIKKQNRFHLLDFNKIAALYDVTEQYDRKSDELGHMPFTQEYYAVLGTYIARKISAFKGQGYKVIALDCDNTLWKGVCGELGAMDVVIDDNFGFLQQFFLDKYHEGFLLVLCSKNNEEDVWEVFDKHPGMILRREHIAAHRINWEPKSGNLLNIAKELNLGINSFIFLDDSEFEVEQMGAGCPDALSLVLPEDITGIAAFLNHIWAFDSFRITEEDMQRNNLYKVEKQRKDEQIKYDFLGDFLDSLNIKVDIRTLNEGDIERAVQLSLRTNQFNLNGVRKTPEEIVSSMRKHESINWIIEVKDRFGEYGIVGLLLAEKISNSLVVKTFLLSCRVLGRNVEDFVLSALQEHCAIFGLNNITVLYEPTSKNKPFKEFLNRTEWISEFATNNYSLSLKINVPN